MRLSWYADTGVAVFSIWQGGTCTGTFRLPIADLPRMVEALRRGPHGHDDQVTGEQPGSREPRLPAAPGPPGSPGPVASSRPELLDRDIETGQSTAAVYAPPAQPEPAGYQAAPPLPGYPPEPPGPPGYRAQPLAGDPGYQAPPPQPGYRGKATRRRRGPPPPAPPAEAAPGHRGADLASDPRGYPAGLAPAFPDEYPAAPPAAGLPAPRGSRHRSREGDEDPGGYPGEPLAPDLPPEYSAGYQDQLASGYPGEAGQGYQAEPGYLDEEALGPDYPLEYRREDPGGPYPAGPPAEYPDEQDYPGYPDELPATEYGPPARPYLDDPPGMPGADEPFAEGPPAPATRPSRRRAEPSPESFPYGPPPGSGQSRRRERYPRRH
jgi:hypothetical protein